MKTSTHIWVVALIILLAFGAYFLGTQKTVAPTVTLTTENNGRVMAKTFTWSFTAAPSKKDGDFEIPMSKVLLKVDGKEYPLGNYEGSCAEVGGQSWQPLKGEVAGAVCYFAGGGKEIGIFLENDVYLLKEGIVEEGDAETPGTRSNFKVLKTL